MSNPTEVLDYNGRVIAWRVIIRYGAIENKNKQGGGWLPILEINGRRQGDEWQSKGFDYDEALKLAKSLARDHKEKYSGDYEIELVLFDSR